MASAISCPTMWSSVYECQTVECAFNLRRGLSVVSLWCDVYSVVCPCQLFCSAWMCCLEEVYRCLQL